MSLQLAPKRKDISVRSDPNFQKAPKLQPIQDPNVPSRSTFTYKAPFEQSNHYTADSIYDFTQKIMYDWFPRNNFTTENVTGTLTIHNQDLGGIDFKVLTDQTITADNSGAFFTTAKDVASSWVFVKGNLTVNSGVTFTPPSRKLFTVLYVSGDLTFNDSTASISMTRRGANHSGTGDSGGSVTATEIKVSPNIAIAAAGGAGAAGSNTTYLPQAAANQGTNGSTTLTSLQTGGGGGGWWDYYIAT